MADPLPHERLFFEVMWRHWERGDPYPLPWWVQQCFRRWLREWDRDRFATKEGAFAANPLYRYWNMVGVKNHREETLVGQAGEVEPVHGGYSLAFFLFEPQRRALHLPQLADPSVPEPRLRQDMLSGFLPVVVTTYRSSADLAVEQRTLGVPVRPRRRDIVLNRLTVRPSGPAPRPCWLCVAVLPGGPSGLQRHDPSGRYLPDRRLSFLRYLPDEQRVEIGTACGPVFDAQNPPARFGVYGNPEPRDDPEHYLANNPFRDLAEHGTLNGEDTATDFFGGLCSAVFGWPVELSGAGDEFHVDIRLPVDDVWGDTCAEVRADPADRLERRNREWWRDKLTGQGLQPELPAPVAHLGNLYRLCRASLLVLSDHGALRSGPMSDEPFRIRDSVVAAIACALAGDSGLATSQLGGHIPTVFNLGYDLIGPARAHGFFGTERGKNRLEWDGNGQVLWALGRLDRILGKPGGFGAKMFSPYVTEGARWIRDNRSEFGLLHSGGSAGHVGDEGAPHYWDDLWALAGLYEAGRLAERLGLSAAQEIWDAFADLREATVGSVRWVLDRQRERGEWHTFVPTGPADVGRFDPTMIGGVAYFHPGRLHQCGALAAPDVDEAFRSTLDTIWTNFVDGGFPAAHASGGYAPYLTLQLAHAFLCTGRVDRMDQLLAWAVNNVAYATVSRAEASRNRWQVVQGSFSELHCYPMATDFRKVPESWWQMGDMPHAWAAAEFLLLLRDILFQEADEDGRAHIHLAPGVPAHWVGGGRSVGVTNAPTVFGRSFGYRLTHDAAARTVTITVTSSPGADVGFVYPCRFGVRVSAVEVDGCPVPPPDPPDPAGGQPPRVVLPAGFTTATVRYAPR